MRNTVTWSTAASRGNNNHYLSKKKSYPLPSASFIYLQQYSNWKAVLRGQIRFPTLRGGKKKITWNEYYMFLWNIEKVTAWTVMALACPPVVAINRDTLKLSFSVHSYPHSEEDDCDLPTLLFHIKDVLFLLEIVWGLVGMKLWS